MIKKQLNYVFFFLSDGSHDFCCDFFAQFEIVLEHLLGGISSLGQLGPFVGELCTTFLNSAVLHAHIDQFAIFRVAHAEHDFELHLVEGRNLLVPQLPFPYPLVLMFLLHNFSS